MFVIYLRIEFKIPSSIVSLVTANKQEGEDKFRITAMLLFFILQKIPLTRIAYYPRYVITHQFMTLCYEALVSLPSHNFGSSVALFLLIVRN
jgi:hypothetical protein